MPATRSQINFSQQGPLRGDGRGDLHPGRAPFLPTLTIPGYAGFYYNTQQLSLISAERAAEGIKIDFIFHSLESMTDAQYRYIAFQLHIPVAVRVYNPVIQRLQQNRVTYNCIDYQSTQSAYAHLYVSQYLIYTILALTRIVAFHTLKRCAERRPTRQSARLDADRSSFRAKCSISSH